MDLPHSRASRILARFRRLSWKLTLRYMLTTVGGLLVVELLGLALLLIVTWSGTSLHATYASLLLNQASTALPSAFAGTEPDLAAIHRWLQQVEREGLWSNDGNGEVILTSEELRLNDTRLLVLDHQQRLLGQLGQPEAQAAPLAFDPASIAGLELVLPRALAGWRDAQQLYTRPGEDQLTIAAPVPDSQGQVAGVLIMNATPRIGAPVASNVIGVLLSSLLIGGITSALMGTIFGYFTARSLTRRLTGLAATAAAWGAGDFSRSIVDRSADEIGQLGRQLNRMAAQLQELLQSRERLSVLEERNRLARELHDSVKQQAFAVSMHLGAAQALWETDPALARARLDAAFELARQSQQELTTIIQTLRPVPLQDRGLQQALRDYIADWHAQSAIAASFEVQGEARLPLRVEEDLFRLTQEALANVARHSRASAARVSLSVEPGVARLEIRDDGQGFDLKKRSPGMGLASMRERVESIGGTLSISSGTGGTRLLASIPLPALAHSQAARSGELPHAGAPEQAAP